MGCASTLVHACAACGDKKIFVATTLFDRCLSITMQASFCIEAVQEALENYGAPDIFNMDQGSQFTFEAFTSVLLDHGNAISMDGRGAWRDNAESIGTIGVIGLTKTLVGRLFGEPQSEAPSAGMAARSPMPPMNPMLLASVEDSTDQVIKKSCRSIWGCSLSAGAARSHHLIVRDGPGCTGGWRLP